MSSPYLATSSSYDAAIPLFRAMDRGSCCRVWLAPLDPAGGLEVDARMALEVRLVSLLAPQEQADAVMGPGNDQRDRSGGEPDHAVAA